MTVHDQHTSLDQEHTSLDQHASLDQSAENADLTTDPAVDTHDHSLHEAEYQAPSEPVHSDVASEPAHADVPAAAEPSAEPSSEKALFADDELSSLQSRWADVQAVFVDDPRDCVQKADGLVSDVVQQITSSFSQARAKLEEQWARGEDASTEDLRVALTRYREFFQRLLAVSGKT
jgi:hypothetical protein